MPADTDTDPARPARRATLPLVYACSGCSSAAQLANHLAVRLDREGRAEMSCIAGVGGDVPALVKVAVGAAARQRPVLVIDGCPLSCARQALARHGVAPSHHLALWEAGVRKRQHEDFDPSQAAHLMSQCQDLLDALQRGPARGD